MVGWVAVGVAGVVALVVLGFCAYELSWKAKRLRGDVATLQRLAQDATVARSSALDAQVRLQNVSVHRSR
ncbi:MAG: hypothetical protein M3140_07485 [Actinomycetota bacterium]|nr:hypothetical protein [Actinomycetota bacterium]